MQDGPVEAAHGGELGIGVQRVAVAGEAVEQGLIGAGGVGDEWSGSRSGIAAEPEGPRSPPHPPSPRMNSELVVVHSGWRVPVSVATAAVTTTAAEPLS